MSCFRVYSNLHDKKLTIFSDAETNMINDVISQANAKWNMSGCTLVLQKDGSLIDDDRCLKYYQHESLILLTKKERWIDPIMLQLTPESPSVSTSTLAAVTAQHTELPRNGSGAALQSSREASTRVKTNMTDDSMANRTTEHPTGSTDASDEVDLHLQSKKRGNLQNFKIPWTSSDPFTLAGLQKKQKRIITATVHLVID